MWSSKRKRRRIAFSGVASAVIAFLLAVGQPWAGEIEPRAYVNTPVGVNFLLSGYVYSEGGLWAPGSSPLKDANLKIHTGILAYARTLDVGGRSGKFDVIVPYSGLSGDAVVSGERRERNVSGFASPLLRFSVNFLGAPALSVQEFSDYRQDVIVGAGIQVSPPLGQYDGSKLINVGSDRWFFKPDIGISKAWGDFTLELSSGVYFFTRNDNYFGGKTLEQDPLYTVQAHATYGLGRGVWAAVSGTYDYGGRTTAGGVRNDDLAHNSRAGVTLALPLDRRNSVKLYASGGIHTTSGNDFDLFGVLWQRRWGRGL